MDWQEVLAAIFKSIGINEIMSGKTRGAPPLAMFL